MNNSEFRTDSFQLASFLLGESCHLLSVNKSNPRRAVFVFEDSEKRRSLTEKFLSHQALIEPHRFYSAQKDLKQILYQEGNNTNENK